MTKPVTPLGTTEQPPPLWPVVTYWLALIVFAIGGGTVGYMNAPTYMELRAVEATVDSLEAVLASREPWDWFLSCDPDPFSHIQNWDKVRDLVGVACPPGIQIPEDVEEMR